MFRFGRLFGPGRGGDVDTGLVMPLQVDDAVTATVLAVEGRQPDVSNIVAPDPQVSTERAPRNPGWQARSIGA